MRAALVVIAELGTVRECLDAIEEIEGDFNNVVGGRTAFFSGGNTELTKAAANKIAAIERKMETLMGDDDDTD
jgi:hypothetical protein